MEIDTDEYIDILDDEPFSIEVTDCFKTEELEKEEDSVEYFDEIVGTVVQSADGTFYIATDFEAPDFDLDSIAKFEVVVQQNKTKLPIIELAPINVSKATEKKHDVDGEALDQSKDIDNEVIIVDDLLPLQFDEPFDIEEDSGDDITVEYAPASDGRKIHKVRTNRRYGNAVCHICGESFLNPGRLKRHYLTHQRNNRFWCPLCNKTYKFEYNCFSHWRNSCPSVLENLDEEERQKMNINDLRNYVYTLEQKVLEQKRIKDGTNQFYEVSKSMNIAHPQPIESVALLDTLCPTLFKPPKPTNPQGRMCPYCNIVFFGVTAIKLHLKMAHRVQCCTDEEEMQKVEIIPATNQNCDNDEIIDVETVSEPIKFEQKPEQKAELAVQQDMDFACQELKVDDPFAEC